MSKTWVTTEGKADAWVLGLPPKSWPWPEQQSCPNPTLSRAPKHTHTHTLRNDFPTHHHGSERAALCLREAIPVAGNLNCHPGTHPCLGVGTPQHLPHLRFVGVFKGTAGFSQLRETADYPKGMLVTVQV